MKEINLTPTLPSANPNWQDFERYLHGMNHSDHSIKTYKHKVKIFFISNPNALEYDYTEVLNYFEAVQKTYENSSTKDSLLTSIKKYYDYLIARELRDDHPCKELYLKKRINKTFVSNDIFTRTELESLLQKEEHYKKLRLRNRALLSLLIYQGLTSGEICYLKTKHIDLDKGTVYVSGTKLLTNRYLELYPEQIIMLEEYLQSRQELLNGKKSDALFIGFSFNPINAEDVSYLVSTFKGLFPDRNLNPITIRQSVIYNLLNIRHIPLDQVQLFAGHKWISSTARYIQSSFEEERGMLNGLFADH
jgi:site-specific recombinase XerD